MKTLIKKNLYFNNTFDAEAHHNVSSKFMGNTGVYGGGAKGGGPSGGYFFRNKHNTLFPPK